MIKYAIMYLTRKTYDISYKLIGGVLCTKT